MTTLVAQGVPDDRADHTPARRAMIDSQLRTSGVNEGWVLAAMAALPREDYVPAAMRHAAYIDRAISLGNGRWLASPLVHARFLAEAVPTRADRALLVGEPEGYLAALLRPLVGSFDTLEPGQAPASGDYTLIVIDGAIEQLPDALAQALAEGGRLVTGTVTPTVAGGAGTGTAVTRLAVGRKVAADVTLLPLAEQGIPVLPEYAAPKRWSF